MPNAAFKDNVVIVTGASRGIGAELAYQLADQGSQLALAARNIERLNAVAEECKRRGAQAFALQTDITDEQQCIRLIERTIETYGRLDTLLNNAGWGQPQRIDAMPNLDTLKSELALNYFGTVQCTYHALPHLKRTKGRIVGVSSLGALVGLPNTGGYNSSKHAMRGFMNTLRAELTGTGVSVTVLYLGAISTERLKETIGEKIHTIPTMTPQRCAQIILDASARRKRQVVMTLPGKLLVWLYFLMPGLIDPQLIRLGSIYQES